MAQGPLPFEHQCEEDSTGLTSFAGLPLFLALMFVMGFAAVVRERLTVRPTQGWSDTQHLVSLICLHLAGGAGQMPSGKFGPNAAWWIIALIACNLHVLMQRLAFGRKGLGKRLKSVRFRWLQVAGRVIRHARKLIIRLLSSHPALPIICDARAKIHAMSTGPPLPRLVP